jgi:hypothetical protein
MPYVNIKVTREGVTAEQKAKLIRGVTDLLVTMLNKSPATTLSRLTRSRRKIGASTASRSKSIASARPPADEWPQSQ